MSGGTWEMLQWAGMRTHREGGHSLSSPNRVFHAASAMRHSLKEINLPLYQAGLTAKTVECVVTAGKQHGKQNKSAMINMNIQRLRNLTTRRLHTKMSHIYQDLETILGKTDLTTDELPMARQACEPWLKEHVTDPRFWDSKYDTTHVGDLNLPTPSEADRKAMLERYSFVSRLEY